MATRGKMTQVLTLISPVQNIERVRVFRGWEWGGTHISFHFQFEIHDF